VTRDDDCVRVVHETVTAFGTLHVLVNAAGISRMVPHADLHALSADDFHRIYAVNTIGPFQMTRAAADALTASSTEAVRSAVVNISSRAAHQKRVSPLERLGHPDEVAEAIHWLATSASMVTGSIVELDFGMHLNAV
jgi:NAD(P)-dependent dehydrogenase (short-subunit alcohol dehydrogenase family)